MTKRVVFVGPPGAGKSTLAVSTHLALATSGLSSRMYEEPYSDTHAVIMGLKPPHRRQKRDFVKPQTLQRLADDIANDDSDVVLIDAAGKLNSASLPYLLRHADCAVLVGRQVGARERDKRNVPIPTAVDWDELLAHRNVPVLARVESWTSAVNLVWWERDDVIRARHLERQLLPADHEAVAQLKDRILVSLCRDTTPELAEAASL